MAHVLVAEDNDSVRAFVERALETLGHSVTAVADGGAALTEITAQKSGNDFDLVLTDIVMPVMDGISLALKLAASHPDLPVVMMTGYSAERQRAHNLDELILEVLEKPFSIADLEGAVKKAVS
ncbi:MAG: response regulator [Pseudomonadota bacterium]